MVSDGEDDAHPDGAGDLVRDDCRHLFAQRCHRQHLQDPPNATESIGIACRRRVLALQTLLGKHLQEDGRRIPVVLDALGVVRRGRL